MTSLHPSTRLIRALYAISREKDAHKRSALLEASLKEVLRWFTLTARQLLQGLIQIPHQTQRFFDKHKIALSKLADPRTDTQTKKNIILTPGGSGSLGGVIIRSLLRWDPNQVKKDKKKKKKKKPTTTKKKKSPRSKKAKTKKTAEPKTKKKKSTRKKKTRSPTETRVNSPLPSTPPSSSPAPMMMMMPAKPDLRSVFPNLMKAYKPVSRNSTSTPSTSQKEDVIASVAAAKKVASPKTKVQNRTGMLQSLLDLSKQELSRFSPLTIRKKQLIEPLRSVVSVPQKLKLIRRTDHQWRRIPV